MSSHSHLQIFTPDQRPKEDSKFHLFPQLAKELRQKIWMHALERRRIIHLALHDPIYAADNDNAEGPTEFPENGETFWAITDGHQTISKLFRVNSDSRQAALSFYRVRLPCKLRTIGGSVKWGIVYFNPEHDFLHLTAAWSVKHTLFNFMYHLKTTYDPRGIGLLNLVVTAGDLTGNDLHLTDPLDPELQGGSRMAFTQIMENLREVIFYTTIRAGRQILGWHTGVPTSDIVYNRSFPIEAKVPTFDRLSRDPRTIGEDLKQVYIGLQDNRDQIHLWYQLLKRWDISGPEIEYKWHIAFEPQRKELIFDHTSANKFIQREENIWTGIEDLAQSMIVPDSGYKFPVGAESEKYKNEDLETAVRPAFGFWLFPIDVLEPVQKNRASEEASFSPDDRRPMLWDFSDNWPELWVANLPEKV